MEFSRSVTQVGDVHLVSLSGELDAQSAQGLSDWLVEVSGSDMVIDLSNVAFMDSSGLSAFAVAKKRMAPHGNDLRLTRPQPIVQRMLEITGLGSWVTDWDPRWEDVAPIDKGSST